MFDSLLTQKLLELQAGAILPPAASAIYLFLQRQEVHFQALALFYQTISHC
ncbi:MAG: hypothetical protein KME26_06775 [Oscillatoria princeps RMCB-10]|jgi:hypothetical protein|nr:hypothetical protein [Oscillatoria princeps RMCB-10]